MWRFCATIKVTRIEVSYLLRKQADEKRIRLSFDVWSQDVHKLLTFERYQELKQNINRGFRDPSLFTSVLKEVLLCKSLSSNPSFLFAKLILYRQRSSRFQWSEQYFPEHQKTTIKSASINSRLSLWNVGVDASTWSPDRKYCRSFVNNSAELTRRSDCFYWRRKNSSVMADDEVLFGFLMVPESLLLERLFSAQVAKVTWLLFPRSCLRNFYIFPTRPGRL